MFKPTALAILFLFFFVGRAQEISLPADLRQHTLNQYNASLFNPAFSLDRNNPQSVAFWTRWQWQSVDADPTTLFLNYSRRLDEKSGAAIGFFQHNTSVYFNRGGTLNYAYQIAFNRLISLSFGANVFGFVQELADTRFPVNPIPGIPQSTPTNDFILQVAPGFNLQVENFSLGLASENLIDYNFTDKVSNTAASDKIFMGMASYDFPIMASDSTAYIRPSVYLRTIPEQENQVGINALFSTKKFWVQSGYNNFYGISVGAGGTFFERFSLGALVEFGASSSVRARNVGLNPANPTFEIIASYFLGKPEERRPLIASGITELDQMVTLYKEESANGKIQEELEKAEKPANQEKKKDEPQKVDEEQITEEGLSPTEEIDHTEKTRESKKEARRLAAEQKARVKQRRKDSIAEVKREKEAFALLKKQEEEQAKKEAGAAATRIKEQQRLDSIAKVNEAKELAAKKTAEEAEPEVVTPRAGEKYEEVATEDGLEPGFYLIANVFGTKKYFDAFMRDLTTKGLQPKSFFRSRNKYNYTYLERYDTINEARQARDSNFDGTYNGNTWIFRVVGK